MSIQVKQAALVFADISGYTRFTKYHAMALLHAEQIISDLLEAVIDSSAHPLKVNKIEGDAVLFYAESQGDPSALCHDVLSQTARLFEAFKGQMDKTLKDPVCWCSACQQAGELRLKVLLHFGEVAIKQVKTFEELAGESVITLFRLTKNSIPASEYILLTEDFQRFSGDMPAMRSESRTEQCEGIGKVKVTVLYPDGVQGVVVETPKIPMGKRFWQYLRVNGHAIMRIFRLRPQQEHHHLPRNK